MNIIFSPIGLIRHHRFKVELYNLAYSTTYDYSFLKEINEQISFINRRL